MIAVSNEFKNAIKSDERRIKGYVEVLYDVENIEKTPTAYFASTYTDLDEIVNGVRIENNYASLDYLPLDGTRLSVLDDINTNAGYISDDLFEDIANPIININFAETTIQGITIYFKDNYPTDLSIVFNDNTEVRVYPDNEIVQIILDEPKTVVAFAFIINDMAYSDRKIKIQEVDLGISYVYKDQDLIEFTVDEEVNKLVEEVPINETNITINNINDLFNPLNPQGIVKYLTEGSVIIPHIGVLTETQGVEYVKMGEYYFDSYTNNSDKTTTLNGKNIIKKIEKDEVTDGLVGLTSTFVFDGTQTPAPTLSILDRLPYNFNFNPRALISYNLHYLDDMNLMNYLRDLSFRDYSIIYADRNNTINIRNPITNIVETLTKTELIEDVSFELINRVNTIKRIADKKVSESESGTSTTIFNSTNNTFILTKPTQNFAIKNDYNRNVWALSDSISFTYNGVNSASIVYGSCSYTIVQATGTVGNTATFNCVYNNHKVTNVQSVDTFKVSNKTDAELETVIENSSWFNAHPGRIRTDLGQLEYTPSYEITFDYNGDPSLEAGDYISVETPYGYKNIFIQKNTFKFNGGLQGSIEGVE